MKGKEQLSRQGADWVSKANQPCLSMMEGPPRAWDSQC